jgi:hypothetical protein
MWSYFQMIDQTLYREIDDLQVSTSVSDHLPRAFYINAHAKIRIAIKLAFQGCMQECRSVLRDAVEWAAYAPYMMSDPAMQRICWQQDEAGGREITTPLCMIDLSTIALHRPGNRAEVPHRELREPLPGIPAIGRDAV